MSIPGISSPWWWACASGRLSPRSVSQPSSWAISSVWETSIRSASFGTCPDAVRSSTNAVISRACWWCGIMLCTNATSASVCPGCCSSSSISSGRQRPVALPGCAQLDHWRVRVGWLRFGVRRARAERQHRDRHQGRRTPQPPSSRHEPCLPGRILRRRGPKKRVWRVARAAANLILSQVSPSPAAQACSRGWGRPSRGGLEHGAPAQPWQPEEPVLVALGGVLLLVAVLVPAASYADDDPRVGLAPGYFPWTEASSNIDLLDNDPRVAPFDAPPGNFGFVNSDLAFTGDHAIVGSFNGFQVYDISDPTNPTLRSSFVCPGGQGDPSVYGDLLFMSVEETRGRIDCGTQGAPEHARQCRPLPRRADLRHQRPRQPRAAARRADLPRLAHPHDRHQPARQEEHLHLQLRHLGRPTGRGAGGLRERRAHRRTR